jgi:predicted DNA-binding antitoxin AbrB/MazE fold protein
LPRIIKATYRNGIIEPLEELDLTDGAEVTVILEDVPPSLLKEEKRKRFLASAGSWKDIVDEKFLDEIYRQRSLRTRSEVKL